MELETFEQTLRQVLAHLYDPDYAPPDPFWPVMGIASARDRHTLQRTIIEAIQDLQPEDDVPETARIWRHYELLSCRYIHEMTQKDTAQQLNVSPRHLRREQQQAVQVLAQRLWEKHYVMTEAASASARSEDATSDPWSQQMREELAAIQDRDPNATADIRAEFARAVSLTRSIPNTQRISLTIGEVDEDLVAEIHPSVLRQILITAIDDLFDSMRHGSVVLSAGRNGDMAEISLTAEPLYAFRSDDRESPWSKLARSRGTAEYLQSDTQGTIHIQLPIARRITVAVIDDNEDVVYMYRRYTAGTQYQVEHLVDMANVLSSIDAIQPDMIVLDVMMPDADGWELLVDLKQHPSTTSIPVIICSVIRSEELAMTFGAAAYLSKPIMSEQFLRTLDQAWMSVSEASKRTETHSPG